MEGAASWPPPRNSGQIAFKTPAPALTAQVNCAYAYAAASHADAWLAEHFQKQNALKNENSDACQLSI
jgi:hypothetical protein